MLSIVRPVLLFITELATEIAGIVIIDDKLPRGLPPLDLISSLAYIPQKTMHFRKN